MHASQVTLFQGSRFKDQGSSWFKVQGSGFRVQVSGFRFQGSGFEGIGFKVGSTDLYPRRLNRDPTLESAAYNH